MNKKKKKKNEEYEITKAPENNVQAFAQSSRQEWAT